MPLLRGGKRTSETECAEGQNFLGSYSLIKIRMGKVERGRRYKFLARWQKQALENNEFAEETEEFVPTRAHFTADPVMKSKNLSLFCSYQFCLSSGLTKFGPISLIYTKDENFLLPTLISLAPVAQSGSSKVSSSIDEQSKICFIQTAQELYCCLFVFLVGFYFFVLYNLHM